MAAVSGSTRPNPQQTISRSSGQFNKMPEEVIDKIVSFLDKNSLQVFVASNQDLSGRVQSSANSVKPLSIQNFIEDLNGKLAGKGDFSSQIASLTKIREALNPDKLSNNPANLLRLRENILSVKAQLIGVIKKLGVEVLKNLTGQIKRPEFMEDIFELATREAEIDAANLLNEPEKGRALVSISNALLEAGKIEDAHQVAMLISGEHHKGIALASISVALARTDKIDAAHQVAMSISSEQHKGIALASISRALLKAGKIEDAHRVAMSISNEECKAGALVSISNALLDAGKIEETLRKLIASLTQEQSSRIHR